jgi:hypothetical protein
MIISDMLQQSPHQPQQSQQSQQPQQNQPQQQPSGSTSTTSNRIASETSHQPYSQHNMETPNSSNGNNTYLNPGSSNSNPTTSTTATSGMESSVYRSSQQQNQQQLPSIHSLTSSGSIPPPPSTSAKSSSLHTQSSSSSLPYQSQYQPQSQKLHQQQQQQPQYRSVMQSPTPPSSHPRASTSNTPQHLSKSASTPIPKSSVGSFYGNQIETQAYNQPYLGSSGSNQGERYIFKFFLSYSACLYLQISLLIEQYANPQVQQLIQKDEKEAAESRESSVVSSPALSVSSSTSLRSFRVWIYFNIFMFIGSNAPNTQVYSAVYSGVSVYEMVVRGVPVMKRSDDGYLNATQLLKIAGFSKPRRTKILEREVLQGVHEKVQGGYGKYQGTW